MHRASYACCNFFQWIGSGPRRRRTSSHRDTVRTQSVVKEISEGFRLQPVPESTLKDEARSLQQRIKSFVDNCLDTDIRPSKCLLNNDALVEYSCFQTDWVSLLTDGRTRYAALRMLIARVLIARIDVRREGPSLIPHPALRDSYQLISRQQSRGREHDDLRRAWLALTAYLIEDPYSTLSSSSSSSPVIGYNEREEAINATVAIIETCLSQFLRGHFYSRDSLVSAVSAASNLGWILFSQAHVTEFHWTTDGSSRDHCLNVGSKGTMEVFPELRRWASKNEKRTWLTIHRRTMG